ncbi:helix-turn-helix domain-containing protein [Amycolatopsis sp. NPDC089917]|uniref:MarR family winged helix-turn-helix transcriptional regulator n=1 Tax=Amycolatopsis sp. NPDC089917 TaxID=3155187 RepID=UPI00342EE168
MEDDVVARSASLLDGLRGFGANYTEFTRRFANWLGLHSTDAAALVEILYAEDTGSPLSPARLGDRIALTSGATTNLLNRLENLGYVVRTRESADRRKVTLRSGPDIQGLAREFFGPFSAGLMALVAEYPVEEIERFEAFLRHLRSTMDEVLEEQG